MTPHVFALQLLSLVAPFVVLSNLYLYFYPLFQPCYFPAPATSNGALNTPAPFRLLAFGDPQLEGDSSLPLKPTLPCLDVTRLWRAIQHLDTTAVLSQLRCPVASVQALPSYYLQSARKHLDLVGNDYYLAHIYRTLHWWTKPTHVTVLGDLLGSQWISDDEFVARSRRFWLRVFKGAQRVPDHVFLPESEQVLDNTTWARWIINVAGNHDIGYAGDLDESRVARFEQEFGPVNAQVRFKLPVRLHGHDAPSLRLVVLNTMNLDSPQLSPDLASDTLNFVNNAIMSSKSVTDHSEAIVLLTHIPLHKHTGVCTDEPFISYFSEYEGGGIREQNFLTQASGQNAILQGLFGKHPDRTADGQGLGRDGIILTGHDHEGCDVYHWVNRDTGDWHAQRWTESTTSSLLNNSDVPGLREVTVRSMMGDFQGNAAFLSAWWDEYQARWRFEVNNCRLGVQHIWWVVHIVNTITVALVSIALFSMISYSVTPFRQVQEIQQQQLRSTESSRQTSLTPLPLTTVGSTAIEKDR